VITPAVSEAQTDATGILLMSELPPESTFWRFLALLHIGNC
jgi:hypothetical protein